MREMKYNDLTFRYLRKDKLLRHKHKKIFSISIFLFLGSLLLSLVVLTPIPNRFIDRLAQLYEQGKTNLSEIHWIKLNKGEFPKTAIEQLSLQKSTWTWPDRFIDRLAQLYEQGKTNLSEIHWSKLNRDEDKFPRNHTQYRLDHSLIPLAAAVREQPSPQKYKWTWPGLFKPSVPYDPALDAMRSPPFNPYPDRKHYPIPQRMTLSHMEGNNYANCFATNYTKLMLLFSGEYVPGQFLPQIDLRGDRFDDTTYSASGGLVVRYIPKKDGPVNKILGFNAYYDYRQGNIGFFNQIGGGIEILSKRWDFRANVYVPVGGKRKMKQCVFDDFEGGFWAIENKLESVSYAFNAEVGWLMINSQYLLLYLAGGPYYIAGRNCHDKTRGGEFRIQPQYKDYIALNAMISHDPLFNTVYQFEVILHLPLYLLSKKIDKKETCGLTPRQIYQPVIRYDTMPISRCNCWMFNWND